jgi:hypothetical protein
MAKELKMVPWIEVFNRFGFHCSYVKQDIKWTGGWSIGFSRKHFYIGMGVNPRVKDDYDLS